MSRHPARLPFPLLVTAIVVAVLPVACSGGGGEKQLLDRFFNAARLRDNMTLSSIADVTFNPNTQGVVEEFTITEIGEEQRRSVNLRALIDEHARAEAEERAFQQKRQEFQSANRDAIDRVTLARDSGQNPRPADMEIYSGLEAVAREHNEYDRRLSDARRRLNDDRAQVASSLASTGVTEAQLAEMDVDLVTKTVTVDATVRTPDGERAPRTIVFTLQRAIGTVDGRERQGRWIITDLR